MDFKVSREVLNLQLANINGKLWLSGLKLIDCLYIKAILLKHVYAAAFYFSVTKHMCLNLCWFMIRKPYLVAIHDNSQLKNDVSPVIPFPDEQFSLAQVHLNSSRLWK